MNEATARPWFCVGGNRVAITDEAGTVVRLLECYPHFGDTLLEPDAIAARIVRDHNAHDSLVEALERLALWERDEDAFHEKYGRPQHEDSSISWEHWREQELRAPTRAALAEAKS